MHRTIHSSNVLTALQAVMSPAARSAHEPKRHVPPPKDGAGLFIVGDLVLVPGRGALARASLTARVASMPR